MLEPGVPYNDTAHVGTLALTVAPKDGVNLTGSATRSYSRGSFRLAGADGVTNVAGIAELTDLKVDGHRLRRGHRDAVHPVREQRGPLPVPEL